MEKIILGGKYRHNNGYTYVVLFFTNVDSSKEEYPPSVVYVGENGKFWSRPIADWFRSMTLLTK